MENSSPLHPLTGLFTPSRPSEVIERILALEARDTSSSSTGQSPWGEAISFVAEVVRGNNPQLLADVIEHVRGLIEDGSVSQDRADLSLIKQISLPHAFSVSKVDWMQRKGFDLAPSPDSPPNNHKQWATAFDKDAFDWALASLASHEESPSRTDALLLWLDGIVHRFSEPEASRRFDEIEKVRPGIVRQWVSGLSAYNSPPKGSDSQSDIRDLPATRSHLHQFFTGLMVSQDAEGIADWLDPSRYGTPNSVNFLFEAAVSISYRGSRPKACESTVVWASLARAIELRPQARVYWEKHSHPSRPRPVLSSNRPPSSSFPSQSRLFGEVVLGRGNTHWKNWDLSLPMEPLGRMLGASDPLVKSLSATPEGRDNIVQVMKSHPVFMAYGFACLGTEILSWEQAKQFDGFRDRHGYGAARYALSICSAVPSSFDVSLHRYLRQYKGLCDDEHPQLEKLFIDPRSEAKYKAMELRKVSRPAKKKSASRPASPRNPMM